MLFGKVAKILKNRPCVLFHKGENICIGTTILDLKETLESLYVCYDLYETWISNRALKSKLLNKFRLVLCPSNAKLELNEFKDH
jgi:hypothetical protein